MLLCKCVGAPQGPPPRMATDKCIRMDCSFGLCSNSAWWPQCAYLCLWSVKKSVKDRYLEHITWPHKDMKFREDKF